VNADAFLVELLRDGRPAAPGELGRVMVTDLLGRTLPTIRYETGDLAIAPSGGCPCGRPLPVLASVVGRSNWTISLGWGRVVTEREILDRLGRVALPDELRLTEGEGGFRLELRPGIDPAAAASLLGKTLGRPSIRVDELAEWPDELAEKRQSIVARFAPALA
jgi:hypothetical protein